MPGLTEEHHPHLSTEYRLRVSLSRSPPTAALSNVKAPASKWLFARGSVMSVLILMPECNQETHSARATVLPLRALDPSPRSRDALGQQGLRMSRVNSKSRTGTSGLTAAADTLASITSSLTQLEELLWESSPSFPFPRSLAFLMDVASLSSFASLTSVASLPPLASAAAFVSLAAAFASFFCFFFSFFSSFFSFFFAFF
mmetsp:Transcript_2617/g.7812  ORF Transcript_2617/g.7812 Transcript_2617/m.7812 type:complete len:200 (-) Transcript_2617:488-1087(-)